MQIEIVTKINNIPPKTVLDVLDEGGLYCVKHRTKTYSANWIRFVVEQGIAKAIKQTVRV